MTTISSPHDSSHSDKSSKEIAGSSTFYLAVRWLAFILATIISCFCNIMLVSNLERSYQWILIPMAVCIELSKLMFLLTSNIFKTIRLILVKKAQAGSVAMKSIATKENLADLIRKSRKFFTIYVFIAAFSVFAATGFSLSITAKFDVVEESSSFLISMKLEELSRMESAYASSLAEVREAESAILEAEKKQATLDRNRDWGEWDAVRRSIASMSERIPGLRERVAESKSALDEWVSKYGDRTSILEEQERAKSDKLEESGSSVMFQELSKLSGASERWLRFGVLLLMGVLIEIAVLWCSPDIKISKSILKLFKSSLPFDVSI